MLLHILTYIILLLLCPMTSSGKVKMKSTDTNFPVFFSVADSFRTKQWNYECLYYFRGSSKLRRRNFLYFTLPNRSYYRRGGRELLTEQVGVQQYNRVTKFTRKIRYEYGSVDNYDMANQEVMDLFLQTPYNSYLLGGDHILSPFVKENAKHYNYRIDSVSPGKVHYSYRAKRNKTQLSLRGTFTYDSNSHCITRYSFRCYWGFILFQVDVKMGEKGDERYWPVESEAEFHYYYYGNIVDGHATFSQDYYTMESDYDPSRLLRRKRRSPTPNPPLREGELDRTQNKSDHESHEKDNGAQNLNNNLNNNDSLGQKQNEGDSLKQSQNGNHKHPFNLGLRGVDLTPLYSLSLDTVKTRHDSLAIAHYRSEPLDSTAERLYDEATPRWRKSNVALAQDEVIVKDTIRRKHTQPWIKTLGTIGQSMFHSYNFTTSQYSTIHLTNPDISYSDWRGITYQQDARLRLNHTSGRSLQMDLRLGYNFRPKLIVGRFITNFVYAPIRNASVSLTVQHRGQRSSTDQLRLEPKNIIDIGGNPYELPEGGAGVFKPVPDYYILFRDFMVRLEHNIEVINGLRVQAGLIYHNRTPHRVSSDVLEHYELKDHYTSFSPHINITYTPGQHYFYDDEKKVIVGSKWPTFMLDYERGTSGVLNTEAHFERWEATVTKRQYLSPLYLLLWKIGGGLFTNCHNIDFVFYEYFNEGITDPTWNDAKSGCFHILNGRYYDNCYRYLRAHAVLESPNLLLGRISTYLIRGERLYLGLLATDRLFPYVELGYGISTHILDISFFTAIAKKEAVRSGVKFTIHLFD